jgi:hypothetical protein
MTTYSWNIAKPSQLITKDMADRWVDSLHLPYPWDYGGGIRFDGQSYHDVDLNIYPPKQRTVEECLCRKLFPTLPKADFDVEIFCKTCGAVMSYSKASDGWRYDLNPRTAATVLAFPSSWRGVDVIKLVEFDDRIRVIEEKIAHITTTQAK